MQQQDAYIQEADVSAHTVDAGNIGGTTDDCVLYLTLWSFTGLAIENDGSPANGTILRITQRGVYRLDVYMDITAHADTDLTAAITRNTNAAGLVSTPTNATTGLVGRIRRKTLPAATAIVEAWHISETLKITDADAHRTQTGAAGPGVLVRVILAGAVADTHPTLNVVGTAANWSARMVRVADMVG